jgi:hypothetical protein
VGTAHPDETAAGTLSSSTRYRKETLIILPPPTWLDESRRLNEEAITPDQYDLCVGIGKLCVAALVCEFIAVRHPNFIGCSDANANCDGADGYAVSHGWRAAGEHGTCQGAGFCDPRSDQADFAFALSD